MIAELDAMLDAWREQVGRASGSGGSLSAGGAFHGSPARSGHKPPAVYSIGIIDYQGLADIDVTGARVLVDEARTRLDRLVRSGDVLGHVEPDTFLLATGEMEPATAGSVMDRMRGALAMPLEIGGAPVSLTVAIGVAFAFDDECAHEMIVQAERDMQRVMDNWTNGV